MEEKRQMREEKASGREELNIRKNIWERETEGKDKTCRRKDRRQGKIDKWKSITERKWKRRTEHKKAGGKLEGKGN